MVILEKLSSLWFTCFFLWLLQIEFSSALSCPRPTDFQCANGLQCIDAAFRCDAKCDCDDMSDEENCTTCRPANQTFLCRSRRCIRAELLCDFGDDCGDNSDEQLPNCPRCENAFSFLCPRSKRCLRNITDTRCDGLLDCSEGEDEENCQSCSRGAFLCQSSRRCIPSWRKCNGKFECNTTLIVDLSDEADANCPPLTCETAFQWRCANGRQCIFLADRCNGRRECLDGSDEQNCTCPFPRQQFQCRDNFCISLNRRCDSRRDCSMGEDEDNCGQFSGGCSTFNLTNNATSLALFRCSNGRCIEARRRCNNFHDCGDGSDELNCQSCNNQTQFQCNDGACINRLFRCDGDADCLDGSDEINCFQGCRNGAFQCSNRRCINSARVCDSYDDCKDRSDEANCSCQQVDQWTCRTSGLPRQCVPLSKRCDGISDCLDFEESDERNCSVCKFGAFLCPSDRKCIRGCDVCDGKQQCSDGFDEKNCKDCAYRCPSNSSICLKHLSLCDGFRDCPNGEDETSCSSCNQNGFLCRNSTICIRGKDFCDGFRHCPQGDDEWNCRCERGAKFRCGNGSCIWHNFVCDGVRDCLPEGLDEQDCERFAKFLGSSTYQCSNGQRVAFESRCDGIRQCRDGSDEVGCAETCTNGGYRCPKNNLCLNQFKDCIDTSDKCESRCSTLKPPCDRCKPITFRPNSTMAWIDIPTRQCANCQCYPLSGFEDGFRDCDDNSDECFFAS